MNVFEVVKDNVTTRQVAEQYEIRVRRNGMACCPFYDNKSPSMKVDKRFHCFGCQADGDIIDFVAQHYGLSPKDAIACGLDTSKSKPDPEVFLIAAEKLGLKPQDCLVVEDSEAGIIAAKRGGMKAMAVGTAQGVEQADYAFEGLDDSRLNWKTIILD